MEMSRIKRHSEQRPASKSVVRQEAEALVRRSLAGGAAEARAAAAAGLRHALEAHDADEAVLWLTTCARVRAEEAAPLVERALADSPTWSRAVLVAAIDAARAVVSDQGQAARVTSILLRHAAELQEFSPPAAARALMGAVMLSREQGGQLLADLLRRWPTSVVRPATRVVCRQLNRMTLSARQACGFDDLRAAALEAERRARGHESEDGPFDRAALLVLLGLLPGDWRPTLALLLAAYSDGDTVAKAGAAVAMKVLGRDVPPATAALAAMPGGSELMSAALAAPDP